MLGVPSDILENREAPNQALQRTRRGRRVCHLHVPKETAPAHLLP